MGSWMLLAAPGTIPLEPGWGEVKEGPGEGPGSRVVRETLEEELRTVATRPSAWKDCSHWTVSLCLYSASQWDTKQGSSPLALLLPCFWESSPA